MFRRRGLSKSRRSSFLRLGSRRKKLDYLVSQIPLASRIPLTRLRRNNFKHSLIKQQQQQQQANKVRLNQSFKPQRPISFVFLQKERQFYISTAVMILILHYLNLSLANQFPRLASPHSILCDSPLLLLPHMLPSPLWNALSGNTITIISCYIHTFPHSFLLLA